MSEEMRGDAAIHPVPPARPTPTVPPTPAAPAPGLRATLALTAFELRLTSRRGENLLATLVIPAGLLAFFSSTPVLPVATERPVDFLLPGVVALAIVAAGLVNLGIATAYERHYGVLKRIAGSPLPRSGLVGAKLLAVAVVELVQVALLVGIAALLFGWRPGPDAAPVLVVAALGLGTATFAGLGLALAGALRAEATLAIANGLFLVLLALGGILVPLDRLPGPLASIAGLLPAAPLADLLRAGFDAGGATSDPASAVVLLATWAAAATGLAVAAFRAE